MISFCDIINCTHFFDLIYYLINWKTSSRSIRNIHFSCLRLLLTYFHLIFSRFSSEETLNLWILGMFEKWQDWLLQTQVFLACVKDYYQGIWTIFKSVEILKLIDLYFIIFHASNCCLDWYHSFFFNVITKTL